MCNLQTAVGFLWVGIHNKDGCVPSPGANGKSLPGREHPVPASSRHRWCVVTRLGV